MTDKATRALRSMIDWDKAREINYREEYGQHLEHAKEHERRAFQAERDNQWRAAAQYWRAAASCWDFAELAAKSGGDEIARDDAATRAKEFRQYAEKAKENTK